MSSRAPKQHHLELDQEEVAYYFTALALGLLAGFAVTPAWITPALSAANIAGLLIGDHPRLFAAN
ncbi:MAG: DUF4956 domain-containing protein [bacterium]|nr:DUF4956 domain-containing protein [bacterium]